MPEFPVKWMNLVQWELPIILKLLSHLKKNEIQSTFHYLSLHKSDYFKDVYIGDSLPNSDRFTDCIVRLPLHPQLKLSKQNKVIDKIISYY